MLRIMLAMAVSVALMGNDWYACDWECAVPRSGLVFVSLLYLEWLWRDHWNGRE